MNLHAHSGPTAAAHTTHGLIGSWWRVAGWGTAALLLLLPLVAMQVTDEVAWTGSDFAFAAALLLGVGLPFELAVRRTASVAYRVAVGAALATGFLLVWSDGAVGINDRIDVVYLLVPVVAAVGAVLVRARARGMVRVMGATAAAQLLLGGVSLAAGFVAATTPAYEVMGVNAFFAALWLGAALLFRNAARQDGAA